MQTFGCVISYSLFVDIFGLDNFQPHQLFHQIYEYLIEIWETKVKQLSVFLKLQDGYLIMENLAGSHQKELRLCHLAFCLFCFGYQSIILSTMSMAYAIWDSYVSQTQIWRGIEDYCEKKMEDCYEFAETKLCEKYFKVPDGLDPGNVYTIRNFEINGFSILRFTIETHFFIFHVGPEGIRHIILLDGLMDFEGEWFPLPSALAG